MCKALGYAAHVNETIPILYQDERLLAVDKPAGLMVHPSRISQDRRFLVDILRQQLGGRLHPVHRLDRATSGVLLLARNAGVAGQLGRAFQERQVGKSYLALVRGWMDLAGMIDEPLTGHSDQLLAASTRYRLLRRTEFDFPVGRYPTSRYSLIALRPRTGRMHQLRRHLRKVFHPIIGDTTYGEGRHNRFFRQHFGIHRLMLHARSLSLPDPDGGAALRFVSPLPEEFHRVFDDQLDNGLRLG